MFTGKNFLYGLEIFIITQKFLKKCFYSSHNIQKNPKKILRTTNDISIII